jgi:hypothetical protein
VNRRVNWARDSAVCSASPATVQRRDGSALIWWAMSSSAASTRHGDLIVAMSGQHQVDVLFFNLAPRAAVIR